MGAFKTPSATPDYAVLIPSKGRPKALLRLFTACPVLNSPHTYIGIEKEEMLPYSLAMGATWDKVTVVTVRNPDGITSWAREQIRREAAKKPYRRYVLSDDNCRFTPESLRDLLAAQAETKGVMAGSHPTAAHFQGGKIAAGRTLWRKDAPSLTLYHHVGMIYWCIPGTLYREFRYPLDCYYDDVYLILWLLSRGFTDFQACLEAKFDKHRHEAGGTGNAAQRVYKMSVGLQRLAQDFPQWMVAQWVQTRVPYARMLESVRNGEKGFQER